MYTTETHVTLYIDERIDLIHFSTVARYVYAVNYFYHVYASANGSNLKPIRDEKTTKISLNLLLLKRIVCLKWNVCNVAGKANYWD